MLLTAVPQVLAVYALVMLKQSNSISAPEKAKAMAYSDEHKHGTMQSFDTTFEGHGEIFERGAALGPPLEPPCMRAPMSI